MIYLARSVEMLEFVRIEDPGFQNGDPKNKRGQDKQENNHAICTEPFSDRHFTDFLVRTCLKRLKHRTLMARILRIYADFGIFGMYFLTYPWESAQSASSAFYLQKV
jgi:hypothetical protein